MNMSPDHKKRIIVCGAFTLSLVVPALVLASGGGFVPLTNDANFEVMFGQKAGTDARDLTSFINSAFKLTLSIGAVLAVLRIAWAGYQYMTSDAWGEKSHAKEILGDVVIGLLLLLSVYLILYQINPDITELKILRPTEDPAQDLSSGTRPV
jgi:hypothetical protein